MDHDLNALPSTRLRGPLIAAAVAHVPFDGWTGKALTSGAAELGLDAGRERLVFPDRTPGALVEAWFTQVSAAMADALGDQLVALPVHQRIKAAVRMRLDLMAPHREAVRRALAVLALPGNAPRAARAGWATADAIWRLAGDTATDWNHDSKRAILAGVYAATLLVWLDDDFDGAADTLAFLDRRIAGVLRFEKSKQALAEGRANLPSLTRFLGKLRYPTPAA